MRTFISRTSERLQPRAEGFTLLELLVVVTLVGILTGVVVLGFTGADKRQDANGFAQRFAFRIELARQRALSRNREWGVYVDQRTYRFAEFDPEKGKWEEQSQRPFDTVDVPEFLRIRVQTEGVGELPFAEGERLPQILVFSSGEVTPFTLYVELAGEPVPWIVSSDGLSAAQSRRQGEEQGA